MHRAIYLYDVEELYCWIGQEADALRTRFPHLAQRYSTTDLIVRWFRYQLRRLCYIVLLPHPSDAEQDVELHNHFFIALPRAQDELYRQIPYPPHLWDQDPAQMRLTHRLLVLEYQVDTIDHTTYLERRHQWSSSSLPGI